MKLSPPKHITFYVAALLALLGLIGGLVTIPVLSSLSFWLVVVGFVVLAAGNLFDGF